jgi:NAD(P)-dependent dehydrogenase (short-subunit alcohol dehydrogenase family)
MLSSEAISRLEDTASGVGSPENIAAAVSFLVSAESTFVSGAELVVDGGQMVYG